MGVSNTTHTYLKQINDKHRVNRTIIDNCFDENSPVKETEPILKERFEKISPLSKQIAKGYLG